MMKFFRKRNKAMKKWRVRAIFIDLHKTRIIIDAPGKEHVPPWIFKRLLTADDSGRNT